MIAGIGTDIVKVGRIHASLERWGEAFARRILSTREMATFQARSAKSTYLATRFAAKEAASKALGTGIGKVSFHHIEILNNEAGAPVMCFSGYALELQQLRGIQSIHVSVSDEENMVVAFVILET